MDYETMLDRAFAKIPALSVEKQDFKIPVVDSIIQGNKTQIRNMAQIADIARRNAADIGKYLTKELAAPIGTEGQVLVIGAKVNPNVLAEKIKKYFEMYVICKECHKPDTHVQGIERGYMTIVCEACGAKYTVKNYL
ncbi:MAG: translation initiation factor IF-2 subunit beta [Candidatus Micrarchaeota archaeon]|nr:translation initiation factor IF-2 subunit beta [Candidatus Micrarchaeota archaeon]